MINRIELRSVEYQLFLIVLSVLVEKVTTVQHLLDIKITLFRDRGKFTMGKSYGQLMMQIFQQFVVIVQVYKFFPKGLIHHINRACVRPETIMHCGERNVLALTGQCGHQHVGGIQGMDIIRRKGGTLALGADG